MTHPKSRRSLVFLLALCAAAVWTINGCSDDASTGGGTDALQDTSTSDSSGATSGTTSGATSGTDNDTSGTSDDTSGSTSGDTSGNTSGTNDDTSGSTSGDTSGSTSGTSGDTSGSTSGDTSGTTQPTGGLLLFEQPMPWTQRVDGVAPSPQSAAIIAWLDSQGGWGTGTFRIDFSIEVLQADASTPLETFETTGDFYDPDCDHVPFPVPVGGNLEGEDAYECTTDGDCHLIVVHEPTKTLYEMWRANITGGTFYGGCAVTWDLTRAYPQNLRGEGCTSADAAGLPIAPLLFSADEVAAGEVAHAIRFILPNARIRNRTYVYPGTHATGAASGGTDAPPYGVRLRLRADFPLDTLPNDGARVLARALQQYGMFLADGGNIALTGQSDRRTEHTWEELGIDSYALENLQVTDFEVVEMGDPIAWSGDCFRNP